MQIGDGIDPNGNQKPTVVIYAREHGNEHDTSFLAEGAIHFLTSSTEEAVSLRKNFCFILIPLLDPDGAAAGKYDNITRAYFWGNQVQEALAYSAWFKEWMDSGMRLDLVLNLHNVRSFGSPHFFSPEMEPKRIAESRAFHQIVMNEFREFDIRKDPTQLSYERFRLGGWLKDFLGPLCVAYESNSQAASRHLSIWELRQMGLYLVRASSRYLASPESRSLTDGITKFQQGRLAQWNKYNGELENNNALVLEWKCREKSLTNPNDIGKVKEIHFGGD